jgi:hypothetical protein
VIEPGATIFYNGQAVPGLRWISNRARPIQFDRAPGRQSAVHQSITTFDPSQMHGVRVVPEEERHKPPKVPQE